ELHDPLIANAVGLPTAANILERRNQRLAGDTMSEIFQSGSDFWQDKEAVPAEPTSPLDPPPAPAEPQSVLLADFLSWAPTYSGPKFNFIHCDFPYGSDAFSGPQSGKDKWAKYSDTAQLYWSLIDCLCTNLDRLMAYEGHIMFWFSMEHYTATLARFASQAPSLAFNIFPLIWLKSDNVGVLPDAARGPHRIYETAFFAAREHRTIVRAVSNAYAAPTNKLFHPSTKPEPVLKHFFQMFVDSNTRLL